MKNTKLEPLMFVKASRKAIALATVLCFLAGCATTHPGKVGHAVSGNDALPIVISAKTVNEPLKESFQAVEITIENTGDPWLRIQKGQIVIADPATTKLSVVVGKDLQDWGQAIALKEKTESYNANLAEEAVLLAGSVAMIAGGLKGDTGLAAAGLTGVVGATGWKAVSEIKHGKKQAEGTEPVPENYVTAPCNVPVHMYLRRWVLLNKPSGTTVNNLVVELETIEGKKGTYELPL